MLQHNARTIAHHRLKAVGTAARASSATAGTIARVAGVLWEFGLPTEITSWPLLVLQFVVYAVAGRFVARRWKPPSAILFFGFTMLVSSVLEWQAVLYQIKRAT